VNAWLIGGIAFGLMIAVLMLLFAVLGVAGMMQFLPWMVFGIILIVVVVIVLAVIWVLIQPKKVKTMERVDEQFRMSAKIGRAGVPALTTGFNLSGDGRGSGFRVGRIKGYTQIIFRWNKGGQRIPQQVHGSDRVLTAVKGGEECVAVEHGFVVRPDTRLGWFLPIIGTKEIVIRTYDYAPIVQEFDKDGVFTGKWKTAGDWTYSTGPLVGEVIAYGAALRMVGDYNYYLSSQAADTTLIEGMRTFEAQRESIQLTMEAMAEMTDGGMRANPFFKMAQEMQKEVATGNPTPIGQQPDPSQRPG